MQTTASSATDKFLLYNIFVKEQPYKKAINISYNDKKVKDISE